MRDKELSTNCMQVLLKFFEKHARITALLMMKCPSATDTLCLLPLRKLHHFNSTKLKPETTSIFSKFTRDCKIPKLQILRNRLNTKIEFFRRLWSDKRDHAKWVLGKYTLLLSRVWSANTKRFIHFGKYFCLEARIWNSYRNRDSYLLENFLLQLLDKITWREMK